MDDRIQEALIEKYAGQTVREDCSDWACLEDEELLSAEDTIDDETEITITMGIQVEVDEENKISNVCVFFHTSCWGDSGLGESDPEEYWDYSECYEAAERFIKQLL